MFRLFLQFFFSSRVLRCPLGMFLFVSLVVFVFLVFVFCFGFGLWLFFCLLDLVFLFFQRNSKLFDQGSVV